MGMRRKVRRKRIGDRYIRRWWIVVTRHNELMGEKLCIKRRKGMMMILFRKEMMRWDRVVNEKWWGAGKGKKEKKRWRKWNDVILYEWSCACCWQWNEPRLLCLLLSTCFLVPSSVLISLFQFHINLLPNHVIGTSFCSALSFHPMSFPLLLRPVPSL